METIKNFINPGKKHDDEVLYGSGRSDDPVLSGTGTSQTHGQGSDVGGSDITGNDPRSTATDPTSTSGYETGKDQHIGTSGYEPGKDQHIGTDRPSDLSGVDDRYPSSRLRGPSDDAATTASIKSGVPGKAQSGHLTGPSDTSDTFDTNKPLPKEPTDTAYTGSSIGSSGNPYSASSHNKLDPRVDLDSNPSGAIDHGRGTGSGLTGDTLPDRTVGSSGYGNHPQPTESTLGRDAALGAGAGTVGVGTAAAHHHKRDQDDLRSDAGRSFPLAGNSDKSGSNINPTGVTGGTTAGPHSSDLANKADPRVDSDLDGSKTAGNPGYGSGTGPTPGAAHQGLLGRDNQTGSSATAGTLPAGQTPGVDHQGSLGRNIQTGSNATTGTLAGQTPGVDHGPESWKHDHITHGHGFVGDPCQHNAGEGNPIFTKGPHVTDTANLLDPHVNPSLKTPLASTGASLDSGVGSTSQGGGLHGQDATELGSGTHSHDDHSRGVPGLGSTGHRDDHHSRDIPELGSAAHSGDIHDRGAPGIGSDRHDDDHHGRDAAVAGALGAAGVGAYASSRDDTPSTENPSTSTGPHHSKLLNKLDPRSSKDKPTTTAETSALIGSSGPGSSSHMPTSDTVGTSHENTRSSESVSPVGVGGYETEKHPRGSEQTGTTASATAVSDTAAVHEKQDYGQDVRSVGNVGSVGTAGQGSYDTSEDIHKDKGRGLKSHLPGFLGGHHEKSTEPTGSKYDETTDSAATDRRIGTEPESGSDHHYGRDAGIASAGIGGGLAAYEAQKLHSRDEPTATTGSSTHPTLGYGDGDRKTDKYSGHDTALAGGVIAGSEAGAESEFSKRDAEQLAEARQKEYEKEQKAIHKEQVKHEKALEKDEKRHEKEEKKHEKAEKKLEKEEKKHEKEEKKHEKELLVAEKKHEKEEKQLEKEEKKHEKELAKEEKKQHDDGKKHGGILGLFHRDKTDKSDNQYENDDLNTNPDGSYRGTETGLDVGDGVQHEKHEPNKLHKDPPAGYYESKGYEPPRTGEASHVTGGAGEVVPGQGDEYPAGSRRTGAGDEDPNVSGGLTDPESRAGQGTAVEPHTGLPVDLNKGLGQGGTDGGPNPGYHTHDADAAGVNRSRV